MLAVRRLIPWMLVVLVVLSSHVAVGNEPTVLTVYTNGSVEYLESTRAFFDAVEAEFPDIKINIETGDLDKFLVMYAAGVVPDLLRLYGQYVPEYAAKGLIQSLEPFMERSSLSASDFLPVLVERSLSYNGELYSLAYGMSVTSIFANVDHFNEAGLGLPDASWRWEVEGIDAARKFARDFNNDGQIDRYFLNGPGAGTNLLAFVYMAGGDIFDPELKYVGDSAEVVDALEFVYDFMWTNNGMPTPSRGGGPWDLPSGNTSAFMSGSWYVTTLLQHNLNFNWDVVLTPSYKGQRGTSIWPETPWAIPSGANNPELSWRVMEYIGSREGQELAMKLGLAMPPLRLDVAQTSFISEYPELAIGNIIDMALAELTQTIPTAPAAARQAWERGATLVLNNQAPARQALEQARPEAEAIVREFLDGLKKQ